MTEEEIYAAGWDNAGTFPPLDETTVAKVGAILAPALGQPTEPSKPQDRQAAA